MGGLVARWYIKKCGGAGHTRKLITLGPLSFDLTLPSLHQFLPEYACIEAPAVGALVKTTARVQDGRLTVHPTYAAGLHLYGDGTVPLVAACREDVPMDSNMLRRVPDHHGNLQRNKAALDEVAGVLTGLNIPVRAPGRMRHLRLDVPELSIAGEELVIRLGTADGTRIAVLVTVRNEVGAVVESQVVVARPEPAEVRFNRDGGRLRPGAYTVDATGKHAGSPVAPVSADTLVWP
ncbi:hypothetical protein [Streptomyces sp. NPDC003832]